MALLPRSAEIQPFVASIRPPPLIPFVFSRVEVSRPSFRKKTQVLEKFSSPEKLAQHIVFSGDPPGRLATLEKFTSHKKNHESRHRAVRGFGARPRVVPGIFSEDSGAGVVRY